MPRLVRHCVVHPDEAIPVAVRALYLPSVGGGGRQRAIPRSPLRNWSWAKSGGKSLCKSLSISGCASRQSLRRERAFWGDLVQCSRSTRYPSSERSGELLDSPTHAGPQPGSSLPKLTKTNSARARCNGGGGACAGKSPQRVGCSIACTPHRGIVLRLRSPLSLWDNGGDQRFTLSLALEQSLFACSHRWHRRAGKNLPGGYRSNRRRRRRALPSTRRLV